MPECPCMGISVPYIFLFQYNLFQDGINLWLWHSRPCLPVASGAASGNPDIQILSWETIVLHFTDQSYITGYWNKLAHELALINDTVAFTLVAVIFWQPILCNSLIDFWFFRYHTDHPSAVFHKNPVWCLIFINRINYISFLQLRQPFSCTNFLLFFQLMQYSLQTNRMECCHLLSVLYLYFLLSHIRLNYKSYMYLYPFPKPYKTETGTDISDSCLANVSLYVFFCIQLICLFKKISLTHSQKYQIPR